MRTRLLTAFFVAGLVGACTGGSAGTSPSGAPGSPAPTAGTATASPTPAPSIDTTPVGVAWSSSPDEKYLPFLIAIDAMKAKGYHITGQQVASDDILYQGLSSNTFQLGMGGFSQVVLAQDAGVPIKVVETRNSTDAVYVAANAFKDCSTLANKPVGIYSPKAILTLFMNEYFTEKCPGLKYTAVTIADSGLRAQAMERGQIDATVLGLTDAIALDQTDPGKFTEVSFSTTLKGIGDAELVANTSLLTDHPSIVDQWIEANLTAIREVYQADDTKLTSLLRQYVPDSKDISALKLLVNAKLWPANGGLAGDGVARSIKFFGLSGDAASIVDQGPMSDALKAVGTSPLTDR